MLVSCVHPVAILRAVFCTICSLSRMHWVTIWLKHIRVWVWLWLCMWRVCFFVFVALGRGEDFQYVDSLACFGCC